MKLKLMGLGAILGLSISANTVVHAEAFTLELKDADTITLQQSPKTIAVYDLSILDTLNALGVEAQIVPKSTFAAGLSAYNDDKYIKAGTLFEPDTAQLTQLKPDLIFVGGRSSTKVDELKSLAPTVDLSANTDDYMVDLTNRTQALAEAFDKQPQAALKLKQVAELQQQLKAKTANKTAVMLFGVNDNYMVHAEAERFGFVYDLAGFKSVAPAVEPSNASANQPRPEPGSAEALAAQKKNAERLQAAIAANPDYIIVLDRGAVNTNEYKTKQGIKTHPILSRAQAVKNNQVIFVDANAWYLTGAGLDNTAFMLNEISQAIK